MLWKSKNTALIVIYSEKRAKIDLYNRERGHKKLEKQITSDKLTKSNINKKGYNKYLEIQGEMNVSIDMDKFNDYAK